MIEVLEEEEDLCLNAQCDTDTPYINKNYFREVFDKYKKVHKCDADLETDDQEKNQTEHDDTDKEEIKFMEQ